MSDLLGAGGSAVATNGRAQNGGTRAAGPMPVPQPHYRGSGVRTPTDIMRQRQEREARRKAENEARQRRNEESRRLQEQGVSGTGGRDDSAGVASGDAGRTRRQSGDPTRRSAEVRGSGERRSGERRSIGEPKPVIDQQPAQNSVRTERPSGITTTNQANITTIPGTTRARGASVSQREPRSVPQERREPSATYSTQQQHYAAAQPPPSAAATAGAQPQPAQDGTAGTQQRGTTSSFPHAFQRWEDLSSHWEGLTSYWIRRLQNNSDEMNREPLNQQMARQVTDLSAAGANLFHAVVELQRLRASSERKFQRWFFDTRAEQERARELQGRLETELRDERQARKDAVAELTRLRNEKDTSYQDRGATEQVLAEVKAKEIEVREMRRELQISKEEARRAWEELGRREQEERDRTTSLRNGEPTLVGGVQVVPMIQGAPSRQTSTNRPSTREGPLTSAPTAASARSRQPSVESPLDEPGYTNYDPARSETDTDPFSENGRVPTTQSTYQPLSASTQPQQQTSNGSSAAAQAAQAAFPSSQTQATPGSTASSGTYLRYGPGGSSTQPAASSFYQHEGSSLQPEGEVAPTGDPDDRSFVPSNDDTFSEEEYEYDQNGNVRRDIHGRPVVYGRGPSTEGSDEYDVQEALDRERMYGQRYGSGISSVEYGSGATSTTGQRLQTGARAAARVVMPEAEESQTGGSVDYSGSGYGWERVPRHHHPTRLSDVLEEDERSRTSPSRASQTSRGLR